MRKIVFLLVILTLFITTLMAQQKRVRAYRIEPGILLPGPLNTITDVAGIKVGHYTLVAGDSVRTGVTAILPHDGNVFQEKVPAAIYIGNGFGKLMGYSQVEELGNLETPIILTNTLSVATAADALIDYTLAQPENANRVVTALTKFDSQRLHLGAYAVMPNHVHAVVQPVPGFELPSILHSWKSFTANKANKLLGRSGAFWQAEYYDHLIRDESEFQHYVKYTRDNPAVAGLMDWPWVG